MPSDLIRGGYRIALVPFERLDQTDTINRQNGTAGSDYPAGHPADVFFHSCRDYVMLPGMKQRISFLPLKYHVQTMVRPARFGAVIRASSGTSIHWLSRRTR